ncbi:hypothetical protein CGLAU_09100 [Corynebacterium glaucum]|uniref:Uncharacterized protein n=1 Tax=Corynebacterium glaucum TaxID=187491 RepID=A0A1Q2HY51_9CORY|nr:hypothetical protein CGLAU_09100 [Corynebacterium glaucum]
MSALAMGFNELSINSQLLQLGSNRAGAPDIG